MGRGKNLDGLRSLEECVLAEVIREGEQMMAAQLATATAADQRALTWAGFIITLAVASFGASATFATSAGRMPLAIITGLLGILLSVSAYHAVLSVRPSKFALPGNRPENWLPSEWEQGIRPSLKQARIEQARCLNNQIDDNAAAAAKAAKLMHISIDLTSLAVLVAGVYAAGFVLWKLIPSH